ncbi:MAG: NUDIX hydrolase [Lachnospiraceae bacterium]|nr:NUDIX hydrolase [Lachnospiraceae bacterium]
MDKPNITKECLETVTENRFFSMVDIQYAPGKHYYTTSRHKPADIVAVKSDEEFKNMYADAVTCFVILKVTGDEPKLLLTKEFRYPTGRFLTSPPAGLMDPEDKSSGNPLFSTAVREIKEETGIDVKETDKLIEVSPLAFSSPGMTDESNALVCAVVELADYSSLSQDGAEGSECFDGFIMLTKTEAKDMLKAGRDREGIFYSIYTWASLIYFVSGLWEE